MENEQKPLDDSLKILAKSSIIVFIGILFSKVLSYLFRMIIARYMGPEIYGLFSLSTAVTEVFSAVFTLGLVTGVIRYISIYRGKNDQPKINYVIKTTLTWTAISGISGGILFLILSKFISISIFHNPKLVLFLMSFSVIIPISVLGIIFLSIIQSYERMKWYTFIRNVLFNLVELIIILLGIFLYFFYFNKNNHFLTYIIITSYIAGSLAMLVPAFFYCKYKIREAFHRYNLNDEIKKTIRKDLFLYSWPLIFAGLITLFFTWTDSFMIGVYKDATAVGIYNVAIPIALLLNIAPQLFVYLLLPLIIKEYARDNHYLVKESTKQVGKWIFILNIPIFIIILIFPGTIINILFGPDYLPAQWALRFLAVGLLFNSMLMVSENLLSMKGKSKTVLLNLTISAILNVILNALLIPVPSIFGLDNSQGLVGASIATMSTYIIWSLLTMMAAKKYTGVIPIRKKMIIIGLISIIPALITYFTKDLFPKSIEHLILQGILFGSVYLLLIVFTGCLDKNDLMIIRTLKDKIMGFRKV